MVSARTGSELVTLIMNYLHGRGSRTFTSLLPAGSLLATLASFQDRLGWDSFVEGRLCKVWLQACKLEIQLHGLRTTVPNPWGTV